MIPPPPRSPPFPYTTLFRSARADPRYQSAAGEGETDLETIGIAFLEKLRPLVAQLHHKLEFSSDDPIFQIVIIGYAPNDYGPEVWVVEYRIEQEQVATRGDYRSEERRVGKECRSRWSP